jgi:hypothetical protein
MEQELEKAKSLSLLNHIFGCNPGIFIDRLNLIRNIAIGIVMV